MADVHLRPDWLRFVESKAAEGVRDAARKIQEAAYRQGITVGDVNGGPHEIRLPVTIKHHDDNTSSVILAHPSGKAVQAKHGTLTRAAAAEGYEVRG